MSDLPGAAQDFQRYAGIGMHFAATVGVFAGCGYWVDAKWGTTPWFLLVGVFSGFGLGLTSMVSKLGRRSGTTSQAPPRVAPPRLENTDPPEDDGT